MQMIACDVETELFPPLGTSKINLNYPCPRLVCMTWCSATADGLIMYDKEEAIEAFFSRDEVFVFHNAQFDLAVLSRAYPRLEGRLRELVCAGRVLDTRVMYLLRDPDPPSKKITLQYLAHFLCGEDLTKGAVRTSFRRHAALSMEQRRYAVDDARTTRKVAVRLREIPLGGIDSSWHRAWVAPPLQVPIAATGLDTEHPDVRYSTAAANLAWHLAPRGIEIDPVVLDAENDRLLAEVTRLRGKLFDLGYATMRRARGVEPREVEVAPNFAVERSWRPLTLEPPTLVRRWKGQVQAVEGEITVALAELRKLAETLELPTPIARSAKTNQITLARDEWEDYIGDLPEPLEVYMEYQKASKYWGSFTRPLVEARARRVFPNYWIPGAATGRWACSRPNLQQVSKELRRIYRPREGQLFVLADYPTLELYTLAQAMYCMGIEGPLMEALRAHAAGKTDIHSWTAEQMGGERQAAKEANFGLPGGMGIKRFMKTKTGRENHWDYYQAREIRELWFSVFWDVRRYLEFFKVNAYDLCPVRDKREWLASLGFDPNATWPSSFELTKAINGGAIFNITLPSGRVIPERTYAAGANCFFQGLGADVMTEAFNRACARDLPIVGVIHDSMMLDADPADAAAMGRELVDAMSGALRAVCPNVPIPTIEYEISEEWK